MQYFVYVYLFSAGNSVGMPMSIRPQDLLVSLILSLSLSLMDPEAPGNYIRKVQDGATPLKSLENPLVSRRGGF